MVCNRQSKSIKSACTSNGYNVGTFARDCEYLTLGYNTPEDLYWYQTVKVDEVVQ